MLAPIFILILYRHIYGHSPCGEELHNDHAFYHTIIIIIVLNLAPSDLAIYIATCKFSGICIPNARKFASSCPLGLGFVVHLDQNLIFHSIFMTTWE